ncbi:MAG: hypothetical protein KJ949_02770 [Nanoarchaeota archaeon]|nr:hypothetical protein [Nanoarchaeota archaeon]
MKDNKTRVVMWILIVIILALVAVMVYAFVVVPLIRNYQNNQQMIGYQYGQVDLLNNMLSQIQQTGLVQIPSGANQSVILRPLTQEELAYLQQQAQQPAQ